MANLKPEEYFRLQYPNNPEWKLIKAVRIDRPNSTFKRTVQLFVWLIKKDKKHGQLVSLYTNDFEADGTTYKKQQEGYFAINFDLMYGGYGFSKSKSEMELLISDNSKQIEMINDMLLNGKWSITQDPWDPNVVPKSLRPENAVTPSGPSASQANTPVPNASTGATQSVKKLDSDFTFNVEKENIFSCSDTAIGELTIIKKEGEGSLTTDPVLSPEHEEQLLDPEYTEGAYSSEEEQEIIFETSKYEPEPMAENSYEETTVVDLITGDDADFWSLMAICACEDGDPQGRADVAQSIYNRVLAGIYGGKTIKKVVCNNGQYEPAFNKIKRSVTSDTWKVICNKNTAVSAVAYAKGIDGKKALIALQLTYSALSDAKYQAAAREWVGPRCDFLGAGLGKKWFKKTAGEWQLYASSTEPRRRNESDNIFGNVVGPGAWKWGLGGKIASVPTFFAKYRNDMFGLVA